MSISSRIIRQTVSISAMILTATMLSGCLGGGGSGPDIEPTSGSGGVSSGGNTGGSTGGNTGGSTGGGSTGGSTGGSGNTGGSTTLGGVAVKGSADANGIITGPVLTNVSASESNGQISITVDGESVTFNQQTECQDDPVQNVTSCGKSINGKDEEVIFQRIKSASGEEYMVWGMWDSDAQTQSGLPATHRYAVHGDKTVSLPASGKATYTGKASVDMITVNGNQVVDGNDYFGNSSIEADFGTGSVNATLDQFAKDNNGTAVNVNGSLALSGSISGNDINFNNVSGTLDGKNLSGSGKGAFFGPNAEAVGGVFKATGNNVKAMGVFYGCQARANCQ